MVLVRMPTAGEFWTKDESMTPKTEFWDRIEEWSGIPTVHFLHHPELSTFDCSDASHLGATDAPEFTRTRLSYAVNSRRTTRCSRRLIAELTVRLSGQIQEY